MQTQTMALITLNAWQDLTTDERRTYLADLTPLQRLLLARQFAARTRQPIKLILGSWVFYGWLTKAEAAAAVAAEAEEARAAELTALADEIAAATGVNDSIAYQAAEQLIGKLGAFAARWDAIAQAERTHVLPAA